MNFPNNELADMYMCFGESEGNIETAIQIYKEKFPKRKSPLPKTFEEVNQNLRKFGRFSDANVKFTRRLEFCRWFDACNDNGEFVKQILFTDEVEFKGDGIHHSFFVNVWGGIFNGKLFGPHFLPASLTCQDYFDVLNEVIPLILEEIPVIKRSSLWFMHDGAPAHSDESAKNRLNENFPMRWIGKGGPKAWPPYSPDLNPMDFYVWKRIDEMINKVEEFKTIDEFKDEIKNAFEKFRELEKSHSDDIVHEMTIRIELCIKSRGRSIKKQTNEALVKKAEMDEIICQLSSM